MERGEEVTDFVATFVPRSEVAEDRWDDVLFALDGLRPERLGQSVRVLIRARNRGLAWAAAYGIWAERVRPLGFGEARVELPRRTDEPIA